jgi:hypothetical protein
LKHTGTFFCDITTAQSLPLMPTDMMFAAVIALNAYSNQTYVNLESWKNFKLRTDLVQSSLVREDGNMPVVGRAA